MKKSALIFGLLVLSVEAVEVLANSQKMLHQRIMPLLEHEMPRAAVGIAVADAKTGTIIYEHNASQAFNPASCAKLFSTAASLYALGPEYRFKTEVFYDKEKLAEGVLNSNLYLKFSGDPSFTVAKLKDLVKRLGESGVHRITGNVEIDDRAFAEPWHGPGWSQEDVQWYFAAPISSIILNENALGIKITSNPTLNKAASLSLAEGSLKPYFQLDHHVNTVTYEDSMNTCEINVENDSVNHISIRGCWPSASESTVLKVAVRHPDELAKKIIANFLKEENIQLEGKIISGCAPEKMTAIASIESPPLKALITVVLKESNNVYAESITKTLGRHLYHQGTFLAGSRAIKSILKKQADIDFDKSVLVDGSGQSRYDLVTPRQLVRVLHAMANNSQFANLFLSALPESGTDGTLSGRMKSPDLAHHIHAKTGSFQGVSTLSGYMTTKTGKPIIFSILINHVVGNLDQSRTLQSHIASVLYQL